MDDSSDENGIEAAQASVSLLYETGFRAGPEVVAELAARPGVGLNTGLGTGTGLNTGIAGAETEAGPPYFEIPKEELAALCGPNDQNLGLMGRLFGCRVQCRGNRLSLNSSRADFQNLFQLFLQKLRSYLVQGIEIRADLLDALYCASKDEYAGGNPEKRFGQDNESFYDPRDTALTLNGKKILPRNRRQHELLKSLGSHDVVFALGPAGTGKTFLAVAYGLSCLSDGRAGRLLLSRPVVEAGENLGFLPGDFGDKIGPYMMPLFDAMHYLVKAEQIAVLEAKGMIEVAPLAYMRGRSLRDAIVILDEAQNATPAQVKMLLTRLGEGSRAILTGDPGQSDLGPPGKSGLYQAAKILSGVEGVAVQHFRNEDVVRSALVRRIVRAYETDVAADDETKFREGGAGHRRGREQGHEQGREQGREQGEGRQF